MTSATPIGTPSPLPLRALPDYLAQARWFGGKGRDFTVTSATRLGEVPTPDAEPRVVVDVVEVRYTDVDESDPRATELYQLPLALYSQPQERLGHAFISWHDEDAADAAGPERWTHAYDAVHDREAMAAWLTAFVTVEAETDRTRDGEALDGAAPGLRFHRLAGHDLDTEAHSTPFSGEQSNSSVMFGDDALLKVFRKVTPGVNPDVEIHDVLTRAGSDHVAALYGWVEATSSSGPLQLGLLQQFLKTASDGWEQALASVRTLLADVELMNPGEEIDVAAAGGDFADEAHRLGVALAEVHASLAEHFEVHERGHDELAALAGRMQQRLDDALAVVPPLAEHEPRLRATFDAVRSLDGVTAQRIHGDLHLGQTLRTVLNWKLVDFEGEPAKPLSERREPDSPWRDVAGMLRSFDYAAHAVVMTAASADPIDGDRRRAAALAWADRNRDAFIAGYLGDAELTDRDAALLRAYVADKAVYEAVYEARNRPSWLPIPLAALAGGDS